MAFSQRKAKSNGNTFQHSAAEPQMAIAIAAKINPKWHERWRRDVARYVSETRSCAAHRFCGGNASVCSNRQTLENHRETRRIWLIVVHRSRNTQRNTARQAATNHKLSWNAAALGCDGRIFASGSIMERETGIEPATNGLGSRDSTTELLPLKSL